MNQVLDFFKSGRCLIIAEVAQSHDGSLGLAHAFIDSAANAGANAIKFQTHIAEAESTPDEPWRVKFSRQDESRFDYWKRMEFTEEQWKGLKAHAEEKGLIFLSSPFSNEAVDLLTRIGIPAWKIASGELTNYPMLDKIMNTGLPILISSGMSDKEELGKLITKVRQRNISFAVLQCTSAYPTPPEKVGINVMVDFREKYGCPVGLSDHSGKIFPGLAAVAQGANIIEVHLALSKEMFGPDVIASLSPEELKTLADGIRFIEKMNANPVQKDIAAEELKPLRSIFTKSIVASRDIEEGTTIGPNDLAYKKPGTGIPASRFQEFIGKKLKKSVKYNHFFTEADFTD